MHARMMLNILIRFSSRISSGANVIAVWLIFILMFVGLAGIITRTVGKPWTGATNLSEFMLVGAVFLAIAYTQLKKGHVAVDFLTLRVHGKTKLVLALLTLLLALAACSVLVWGSWTYGLEAWQVKERMDGMPYYPVYPAKIIVAVGCSFLWLQLLADFIGAITHYKRNLTMPPSVGEASVRESETTNAK